MQGKPFEGAGSIMEDERSPVAITPMTGDLLSRLGERVARLEVSQEGLKEDTKTIRSTQHETHNRMQEFVAAEIRCAIAIEGLTKENAKIQAEMAQMTGSMRILAETTSTFVSMSPSLISLVENQQRTIGAAAFAGRITASVVAIMSILASAAVIVWHVFMR